MKELIFDELSSEMTDKLEKAQNIVFATSANGIVTARTMCPVNDGIVVMFSTGENSEKVRQVRENPNVALVTENLSIEATAELCGSPKKNALFCEKNSAKYPWMADAFPDDPANTSGELVICRPTKMTLYKYIDNMPHWDVLYVNEHRAVRVKL